MNEHSIAHATTTRPPSARLFIGNVEYTVSVSDLKRELESQLGIIPDDVHIATDKITKQGRGFAFLSFSTVAEATAALNLLQGHRMFNRTLRVDYAEDRNQKRPSRPRSAPSYSGGRVETFKSDRRDFTTYHSDRPDFTSAWHDDFAENNRRRRNRR